MYWWRWGRGRGRWVRKDEGRSNWGGERGDYLETLHFVSVCLLMALKGFLHVTLQCDAHIITVKWKTLEWRSWWGGGGRGGSSSVLLKGFHCWAVVLCLKVCWTGQITHRGRCRTPHVVRVGLSRSCRVRFTSFHFTLWWCSDSEAKSVHMENRVLIRTGVGGGGWRWVELTAAGPQWESQHGSTARCLCVCFLRLTAKEKVQTELLVRPGEAAPPLLYNQAEVLVWGDMWASLGWWLELLQFFLSYSL